METGDSSTHTPPVRKRRRHVVKYSLLAAGLLVIVAGSGIAFWYSRNERPPVSLSADLRAQAQYPIYVPKTLPGNFKVLPDSFKMAEAGVLIFQAKDSADTIITFTEQKRPKDLNFTEFYHDSMKDGEVLDGTTHPTFTGKTFDSKTNMLSIVTDETWLLATTRAPLTKDQLKSVANSLYRYSE